MTVSRRSETLKSAIRDGAAPLDSATGRGVAAWRQERGFRPPPLTASHGCAGRPTFSTIPSRWAIFGRANPQHVFVNFARAALILLVLQPTCR